jgi:hypothetical protein
LPPPITERVFLLQPQDQSGEMSVAGPVRMKDVADAAGVARSTVSNAIYRPQLVASDTLRRIHEAIDQLDFKPGEQTTSAPKRPGQPSANPAEPGDPPASGPAMDSKWWGSLAAGDRVQIQGAGNITRVGTVDAVRPDGSIVWLWLDNGLGRIIVLNNEGLRLHRLK